ncbi:DUF3800 domain-containing protein [Porphyrobacter sp. CACIAM 03H1]|uniref:DUF3800 domain-containing protein n=1 Tax=Porphyrobacter sp. CACIAM 03H1 TaxID=2003315 RepID=UPI0012FE400F|nr:DUF3800 domain-containing protein [Porphyrobacter sp. CACIAM 03H1]
MRLIYLDEAGISASEPVAVVVGIIIDPDKDWRSLETYLRGVAHSYMPEDEREGFVFHAKDISAGNKNFSNNKNWPKERRQDFIKEILYARTFLGFSLCVGLCRKHAHHTGHSAALIRHLMAYSFCVIGCEYYIRTYGDINELGMVIAEDTPTARKKIKDIHTELTSKKSTFPVYRDFLPLQRIIDTVHFASKADSPLLQFADACAFAFRRYFAGYNDAEPYVDALYGPASSSIRVPVDLGDGYFTCASIEAVGV